MRFFRLIWFVWSHPLNRGARLRALSRLFRWQLISRVLPEAMFAIPFVNEARLLVRSGMTGATGNWYCGLDEMDEMGFVLHVLRRNELFVDIGANIGSYSILAAAGTGAKVISVEPIPSTFDNLQNNVLLNGLNSQITAYCVGISNCIGKLNFTIKQGSVNHVLANNEYVESAEFIVTTLDDLLLSRSQSSRPVIIKIDVEGHELSVLEGAQLTLTSTTLQAVIIETNGCGARYGVDTQQVKDTMRRYGFDMWRYNAVERKIIPDPIGKYDGNTIFIRDPESIRSRIEFAPTTRLVNRCL